MGLFDFLKPKKNPETFRDKNPEMKHFMMAMKLEYLQKQVANRDAQLLGAERQECVA